MSLVATLPRSATQDPVSPQSDLASSPRLSIYDKPSASAGDGRLWRHELKYVVPRYVRTSLTADIRTFADPDRHGQGDGSYTVRSLYLDSPDLSCFQEKMAGAASRAKLRIRAYPNNSGNLKRVQFEIKYRHIRHISKDVAITDGDGYDILSNFLNGFRTPPDDWLGESSAIRTFFALKQRHGMMPILNVEYRRQAFTARSNSSVRITFDDRLCASRSRDLRYFSPARRPLLGALDSVLEIKVHDTLPYWLQVLIKKYQLRDQAFSKYGHAITRNLLSMDQPY